jgi:hypothetical protein
MKHMSVSTDRPKTNTIKTFAWIGIVGAIIMIGFGINALVAPPQIGDKVVNPMLFQVKNILEIFSFIGYAMICFAFYQSGAVGRGWLAKIAIGLALLGAITASVINVANAIAIQNVNTPDWANIFLFGLVLLAPVLLGISALRTRIVLVWQALYPILIVGVLSIVIWILFGDANPSFPAMVQAFTWIGFALLAIAVKPKA